MVQLLGFKHRKSGSLSFDTNNIGIFDSEFVDLGCGGVFLGGGDKRTLSLSGNIVKNCVFKRTCRINRTYSPGIWVAGFGATIENNTLYDYDHEAIAFTASEVKIRHNKIFDTGKLGMDQASVYTGSDIYERGNVIEENLFLPVKTMIDHNINAIYIDDCSSGVTIRRNIFCRAAPAKSPVISLNKGTDNIVKENIFIEAYSAIVEWIPADKNKNVFSLIEKLSSDAIGPEAVKLYNLRYPQTVDVLNRPYLNDFSGNICFNCEKPVLKKDINGDVENRISKYINLNKYIDVPEAKNVKNWTLKKIEKYFGDYPLVRELTKIDYGAR